MAGRTRTRTVAVPTADTFDKVVGGYQSLTASQSLMASAVRYPGKVARIYSGAKEWQKEAYRHYGICGEARYAANYFGHSLSRCELFVTKDARDSTPLTEGKAAEALDALGNGAEGLAQMLAAIGKHLTIAGECYMVGRAIEVFDDEGVSLGEDDIWEVLSVLEVKNAGNKWSITSTEETKPDIILKDEDVVIRIWRPHPEHRMQADSPFRSLLPVLREIEWLTMHIFAQCSSRLAGAGLMFVSQGLEFPPPVDADGKPMAFANHADGLMKSIGNMMMAAINDPSNPAALMPGVVSVPEDVMKEGKPAELMHFWTELDKASLEMRQAAVHRFALGMDLDPSQVEGVSSGASTGGGNSNGPNHWGMWLVKEETITLHVEPMADLVRHAITIGYLRPASDGMEVLKVSTEKLRLRPDRSKESMELWRVGALKTAVMVKENGFNPETDMPDDEERKLFFLMKIAAGSATPQQVDAALKALNVDLGLKPEDLGEVPRATRPDPTLEAHPVQDLPERPDTASADARVLLTAAEGIALQGLQRIGNRLRSGVDKPPSCPAYLTHTLIKANGSTATVMKDAFPAAEMLLDGIADAGKVLPVIESYCEALLNEQAPHDRDRLAGFLQAANL